MIPNKLDGLRRLKLAFAQEYSTKRAISFIYKVHSEADEIMSAKEEEAVIRELLQHEAQENEHFFVEAVNWAKVRPMVLMMLNQFTERVRI